MGGREGNSDTIYARIMMTTYTILQDRIDQLNLRLQTIPVYLKNPDKWIGRYQYTMEDIPKIRAEVAETEVALQAIKFYRKNLKHNI